MTRAGLVALARSYDGATARDARYVDLMMHPEDPPRMGSYYASPRTSTCALTVLGLWRVAGVRHRLLVEAYAVGHATADMSRVARDLGAYREGADVAAGRYEPRAGDAVMVVRRDGSREHAYTIVDIARGPTGWALETIDGGMTDRSMDPWVGAIQRRTRTWQVVGRTVEDHVEGEQVREVAYVVDAEELMAASRATDAETDPAPDTEPAYTLGLDVSQYQDPGHLDWPTLSHDHRFAIVRASQALEPDPLCAEHIAAAMPWVDHLGLYMVPWQDPTAAEQVAVFRAQAEAAGMDGGGHILPVLDLEGTDGRTPERYGERVREIALLLGEVMIYISPSHYLWMGEPEWLREYPWWIAHYTDAPAPHCPWVEWAIWQHRVAPLDGYRGVHPGTGAPLPIDQNRARRIPTRNPLGTGYL